MIKILEERGIFVNKDWFDTYKDKNIDDIIDHYVNEDIKNSTTNMFEKNFNIKQIYFINFDVIVQVNEIVDISQPYEERLSGIEHNKFTYKMMLQHADNKFIGLLNQNIYGINLSTLPGFKILIKRNSVLRYGVIKLSYKNFEFVGGKSDPIVDLMCSILIYGDSNTKNTYKKKVESNNDESRDHPNEVRHDLNNEIVDGSPKEVMIDSIINFRIVKISGKMEYSLMVLDEDKNKGIMKKEIIEEILAIKPEEWLVPSRENQCNKFNTIIQYIKVRRFLRLFDSETYIYT